MARVANQDEDARLMAAALRLGRRGLGSTWPNPTVGCLVVSEGMDGPEILGSGWTGAGGRPHAETQALEEAGADAFAATLYVTLEPCAHSGQTPPCVDAIVAAGISRVVSALQDPDPRVSGKGYAKLRAAGIKVTEGVLEAEAREAHGGHVTRVTEGRPFVRLKLAHSIGGFISGPERTPVRITGEAAQAWVHRMRAQADAIMVGSGTVIADDPLLTCRLPGAENRSPLRVALDTRLSISPAAKIIATAPEIPTWIICADDAAPDLQGAMQEAGAEIITVAADANGKLPLKAALEALAQRGITNVFAEGGAGVAAGLVAADLADEIVLIEGARDIGKSGLLAFLHAGAELPRELHGFALAEEFSLGEDLLRQYTRRI